MSLNKHILLGGALVLLLGGPAWATILDDDPHCRQFGCTLVHDGRNFQIYDNYQFATNSCCVPPGGQMIPRFGATPLTNFTGTLDQTLGWEPDGDHGFLLGITEDGTTISTNVFDDGDGFLDAADGLNAFTLSPTTDLQLTGKGRQYSHSFFVSSFNTKFSLRALASISNASGDFANTVQLGDIKLTPNIQKTGNDDGFEFGKRANRGNIQIVSGIDNLGDVSGLPTQIINFGRKQGIAKNTGNGKGNPHKDLSQQTLRVDFLYEMPAYDMSMGIGSLDIDMVFDFYNEP